MKRVSVFLSYSRDDANHVKRVVSLAKRLRKEGIDAIIDEYEVPSPPDGWPAWMERMIADTDYVVVICTEAYNRKISGKEKPGRGRGVKWEGALIRQEIYDNDARNERFIPVIFSSGDRDNVPTFLAGATHYDLSKSNEYRNLSTTLRHQLREFTEQR